jgi:hypothetical protein
MVQARLQMNLEAMGTLTRCRTPMEFMAANSSLISSNMELTFANSRRVAKISARSAGQATHTITVEVEGSSSRAA